MDVQADIRALDDIRRRVEAAENAGDAEYFVGLLDRVRVRVQSGGRARRTSRQRELNPNQIDVAFRVAVLSGPRENGGEVGNVRSSVARRLDS